MSDRIHVGTRKGLVSVSRTSSGWQVDGLTMRAIPITAILDRGAGADLVVGASHGHFGPKLHATADGGATLRDLAVPEHPADAGMDPNRQEARPSSTEMIWSLAATSDGTWWCGTMPGGLFSSRDEGASWQLCQALWDEPGRAEWMGGGYDHPAIHSIEVDPRGPERLVVAVSCGGTWRTEDGGATWEVSQGMRAPFMPPERVEDPVVQDPHRVVRSAADPDVLWCQQHFGIYRSTDDARTWQEITDVAPSTFGFAVATHPHDPDTAWFVPATADQERIPVDGRMVVTRTRDGGRTFEQLRTGLPQAGCWDLVYRHALAVDGTGERLAMGSTTGNLWVSEDGGDTWDHVSAHLPPVAVVQFSA
ncbi:MAG: hypothetical protein U0P45_01015 [Acidimicrobiales bacterium]